MSLKTKGDIFENIKCLRNKCSEYRSVRFGNDDRIGYKHKCLFNCFIELDEGNNNYCSGNDNGSIIYNDKHLQQFWTERRYCNKQTAKIISNWIPISFSIIAIIISIIPYLGKSEIKSNSSFSSKQIEVLDSIIKSKKSCVFDNINKSDSLFSKGNNSKSTKNE
ncbi:MAG: hypothetical protein HXX18_03145 [Bacteroidetes bacterium]|nr:hypothetical protein [Bacteroidota bacterium]